MATRKKTRAREAQLAFEALSIEGGLLSPDWLSRAAQLAAGGQSEADYRIPKGLNLRDEIGRFWRIAQAHWGDFEVGRAGKADAKMLAERFVDALLRDSFGFGTLAKVEPVVLAERSYPIGLAALSGRVPVIVAPAGSGLDSLSPAFGDGARRRTAFGLAQEYLNAEDGALWGLASDGLTLRIVRDNASLTRPAWIEVDLQRIFTEERYADFAALWLLAHETRFGRVDQPVAECALESWRSAGREEGTRAREHLRGGVEQALIALGQGFLSHPDNQALRAGLQSGVLSTKEFFNQLLRLVYRLIFLLTVEERGVLHPDGANEKAKTLYAEGYSMRRLRERSVKRNAYDRFSDLWEVSKIVFRGVDGGELRLGLPALAGIFAKSQCPALDVAKLENRALLPAIFKLSWLREDAGLSRVNWRDMGPEELGSVYESLLELVPQITKDGRQFAFASGGETKGNARKTTGSYYTPDSLVQVLLDSALEPVVKDTIARHPDRPVEALLGLAIVDPACGSGHFLLAAARRLASHVARLSANGTPSAAEYRHALRQIVGHCIYGVDLNLMAVELCKVSLWMEAVEPGLPLTFLDSHIQHGNALLGTTPDLMAKGVPDEAWDPIEGDDRKTASVLKKRNKKAAEGQRSLDTLWLKPSDAAAQVVARAVAELEAASDANPEALARKELQWNGILGSPEYRHQKFVADAWCAAFVWPKQPGEFADAAPTNEVWRQLRDGKGQPPALTAKTVSEFGEKYGIFHWHLQFPLVFAKGGFDIVLGNPPWERVKLQEQEFFASRSEEIANATNAAARKKLIARLPEEDPQLWADWRAASRKAEGESHIIRSSGRYPLCGRGDVNTYAIFAEHNRSVLGPCGRAGFIVPTGIATDETTKEYFASLIERSELARFYAFENGARVFPAVHSSYSFALVCLVSGGGVAVSDLVFFARRLGDLSDSTRHFSLSSQDLALLNPETRTCPVFRSQRDADITIAIHQRVSVLGKQILQEDWNADIFQKMIDATIHANVISFTESPPTADWLPVYEGRMVHGFNHRFATYEGVSAADREAGNPRAVTDAELTDPTFSLKAAYWVSPSTFRDRLSERQFKHRWFVSMRYVSRATDERTVLCCVRPHVPSNNKLPSILLAPAPLRQAGFIGNMSSFVFDYLARQKIGGTTLAGYIVRQLPVLPAPLYAATPAWSRGPLEEWVGQRALELIYTASDLEPFAKDVGYDGPPFRWNPERRFLLRCELDAAFFHLYGVSRDDTTYVMDTFPIVRKADERVHGEYRTKRVILEIYDAMVEAARTGKQYQTRLDPPPADPRVAHPDARSAVEKGRGG